jgi:hypothetical protein
MANVASTNVPPVPNEHNILSVPDSKVDKTNYTVTMSRINNVWTKWFMDLRTKVNTINAASISLANITTPGTVVSNGGGNFATEALPTGTYGDTTHVPQVTVGANGYITNITNVALPASGTVTSVGLAAPTQFTVSGSPVTTSGTLTLAWNTQTANTVLAGPTTGAAAAPTFRALVPADLPPFTSSFKNKLINGNFDFWQRGITSAAAAVTRYLADRWKVECAATTAAISQQAFALGQTAVPGEPSFFHRTVVASVAGASNFCIFDQSIESVRTFAGQTATLSFYAKADATKNMAVEFSQVFGSGGSPSAQITGIGVTTIALTSAWQKFTVTVAIPSIAGKTVGTNGDDRLIVAFWYDAGTSFNARTNSLGQQSGTFDIAQLQMEPGMVATPFEVRPLQVELVMCQRYYREFNTGVGWAQTTGLFVTSFVWNMRGVPAVSLTAPLTVTTTAADTTQSSASVILNAATPLGGHVSFPNFALTAGASYTIHAISSGRLKVDAEL